MTPLFPGDLALTSARASALPRASNAQSRRAPRDPPRPTLAHARAAFRRKGGRGAPDERFCPTMLDRPARRRVARREPRARLCAHPVLLQLRRGADLDRARARRDRSRRQAPRHRLRQLLDRVRARARRAARPTSTTSRRIGTRSGRCSAPTSATPPSSIPRPIS